MSTIDLNRAVYRPNGERAARVLIQRPTLVGRVRRRRLVGRVRRRRS